MIATKIKKILAVTSTKGKRHDYRLYKESHIPLSQDTIILGDTGYQGIQKRRSNSTTPHKKKKGEKLTKDEKKFNHTLSSERITVEHVIGSIKRFKIVSDRYRNRRKRFTLRFMLLAGIYNYELA